MALGGTIDYTVPVTAANTLNGNALAATTRIRISFRGRRNKVMPTASTDHTSGISNGCERGIPITVNVTDVNVSLLTQDETCKYANGTFTRKVDWWNSSFYFFCKWGV